MHSDSGIKQILTNNLIYDLLQKIAGTDRVMKYVLQPFSFENKTILDIGCGTGTILKYLPENCKYLGYDYNSKYIQFAVRNWSKRKDVSFKEVDIYEKLDFDMKFDFLFAIGVLHHINDEGVANLFETAKRHMDANSVLVTVDPTIVTETNSIARFLIRQDRGKAIRSPDELISLLIKYFLTIDFKVEHHLRSIPYTQLITYCKI